MVPPGKSTIKKIHDHFIFKKKTPQGAANIKRDILAASRGVTYVEQYQKDGIDPGYHRIIVRHYKLLYKEKDGKILILRVFDTNRNPQIY